jgi:hypothetical protein
VTNETAGEILLSAIRNVALLIMSILFPPPVFLLAAARALLEVPLAVQATVALPPGLNSAQQWSYSRLYRCVAFEKQSGRRRRHFEGSAGCRRQISMSLSMNESDEEGARRRRICGKLQQTFDARS